MYLQERLLAAGSSSALRPAVSSIQTSLSGLMRFIQSAATRPSGSLELAARDLSYSLARIYMGKTYTHHTHTIITTTTLSHNDIESYKYKLNDTY